MLPLSLLLLTAGGALGDVPPEAPSNGLSRVIRDPKTKVVYYVESDLCHVAAVSPEGIVLWSCEVIRPPAAKNYYVSSISFPTKRDRHYVQEDVIDVCYIGPGVGFGFINRKTGMYTFIGMD